jgi:hypothetical protein
MDSVEYHSHPQEFQSFISDALRLFGSPRAMAMPQSLTSIMEKCLIIYELPGHHEVCSFAVSRPVFPPRIQDFASVNRICFAIITEVPSF